MKKSKKKVASEKARRAASSRRPQMPREEFVKLWQSCADADEASTKFPSWPQARARAMLLRSLGVKLKELGRKSRPGISIDHLNKICGGK